MSLELVVIALAVGLASVGVAMPAFLLLQWFHASRGPWRRLALSYPFRGRFAGHHWRMRSIRLRPKLAYHTFVTVGVNQDGLYLASMIPAAGHRPMMIPWADLAVEPAEGLLRLIPARLPEVRIELGGRLLMNVIDQMGATWPAGAALVEEPVYD